MGILQGGCSFSTHIVGSQQMCRQSICVSPRVCTCACLWVNILGFGLSPGMNADSPSVYVSECGYIYLCVCVSICVVCVCVCMREREKEYVYGCVCVYECVQVCLCVCTDISVCPYICVRVNMCVHIYGYM